MLRSKIRIFLLEHAVVKNNCIHANIYFVYWSYELAPFGSLAEWTIAFVLKTKVLRGTIGSNPIASALLESWLSGLKHLSAKKEYIKSVSQVQILYSPLCLTLIYFDYEKIRENFKSSTTFAF